MGSYFSRREYQTIPEEGTSSSTTIPTDPSEVAQGRSTTLLDFYMILQSYFWPDQGTDGAVINRIRSSLTWVMVILSKACNLISPIYLSYGTDNLINHEIHAATYNILMYCLLRFFSFVFKGSISLSLCLCLSVSVCLSSSLRVPGHHLSEGEATSKYSARSSRLRPHPLLVLELASEQEDGKHYEDHGPRDKCC
jgi:hypothetical protein